jgi:hypothetical protein
MWGNAVNGWNGINFSDANISLIMNGGEQGFHHNANG